MTYLPNRNFNMEVSRGKVTGAYSVQKFGSNLDVDSASAEDVIEQGGTITYPTSAESLEIVSAAGADASPSGTGARRVKISGIDSSWALQEEEVNMNGTTAVSLVNTYLRVFRAQVVQAGSGGTNSGQLTVRVASGGATRLIIGAGNGQSLYGAYTVPTGTVAYMTNYYATLAGGSPAGLELTLRLFVQGGINTAVPYWNLKHQLTLLRDSQSYVSHEFDPPLAIEGPADIRLEAETDTDNTLIDAGFGLVVIAGD